ncbi:hypothetical protein SCE1572_01555 [Sorangium cellulosum So0157-2]|uniref:Uncharacterized protein n=1 Tax=Sorangium cellulosum So0157-2 TaxID=1254432 RepID=S4XJF9_SORCE|nr:hypothetical protein SCE1572_01555 [Sorangium cellulosum So0157-2]
MPLVALICSTTTSASHAPVTASRRPMRKPGIAPGKATFRMNCHRVRRTVSASST